MATRKARPQTPQARKPAARPVTCQCCGTAEDVEVTPNTELCETCQDESYVYCTVCKDWSSRDDECRHLTWTDCGYTGAGGDDGLDPEETHKAGVFVFFDMLDTLKDEHGDNLARAAAREIARHRFFTRMYGTVLSADGVNLVRLRFDLHRDTKWLRFGKVRYEDKEGFDEGLLADGYGWLASLEDASTKAANRLTTKWLREWKRERDAGRRPLPAGKVRVKHLSPLPKPRWKERKPPKTTNRR